MESDLATFKQAVDSLGTTGDVATAQDLATAYVKNHSDKFDDHIRIVNEADDEAGAREQIVQMIEKLRDTANNMREAGLVGPADEITEHQYRAEAWQLHRWHPVHTEGTFQPTVRNKFEGAQPTVRNQA